MTAILRNESRQLQRGSLIVGGLLAMLSAFFLSVFPAIKDDAELIIEAYPDVMIELMGIEELHTIEGFAGGYIYPFVWVLFGGIYFSYLSSGMIAGDIQSRKLDLTLSNPVSRESVLAQKIASLWVPVVVLNIGVPLIIYTGSTLIEETINPVALAMVHLLGIPYLLVCAGIGLVLSVIVDRTKNAQGAALVLVFVLWLIDSVSNLDPEYEWVGYLTPSRYYDETAVLVNEEYAFFDAAVLLMAFVLFVLVAVGIFIDRDI